MSNGTTSVTDFLYDRPGREATKLAAVVETAVTHDIKFTISANERALLDEAMFAGHSVPVEIVQLNDETYILAKRAGIRQSVSSSRSEG